MLADFWGAEFVPLTLPPLVIATLAAGMPGRNARAEWREEVAPESGVSPGELNRSTLPSHF